MRGPDDPQGRAVTSGCEGACIAVRQNDRFSWDYFVAVLSDPSVDLDVFRENLFRLLPEGYPDLFRSLPAISFTVQDILSTAQRRFTAVGLAFSIRSAISLNRSSKAS